ncbi:hypothetical protein [Planktothrix sp. FACHB-1365]|uniref:hypothetical protein n=1 Tax=Planktothrix sp. FACHB-1365 TaxID=2692855 RepID=UPI001683CAED|nr:hypothetical protein [Planktothrix sp. FACHB-1365]MBD2485116.1 hypothetical protein [Planktothrix sp. FACHB-1365]
MKSRKSNPNKTIEVDGIRFETLVPEREMIIPTKDGDQTPVQFGIRVTNCTEIPYRFKLSSLMPELQDTKGTVIERSYARNATKGLQEEDFLWAMPNESLTFFVEGELYCYQGKFGLRGYESSGGVWTFRSLNPSRYQVRFTYENQEAVRKIPYGKTVEGLWVGKAYTPWEEFRLVY